MKPIVAIGDVHGLDLWRPVVEQHADCRIVFLGDYLDPYGYIPHKELIANFRAIMDLKRSRPDDVTLILGNHDMHYFCDDAAKGSRFNFQIADKVSRLFLENMELFNMPGRRGGRFSPMQAYRNAGSRRISGATSAALLPNS